MTDLFDPEKHPWAESVRAHLEGCPECRLRFEQDQQVFEAVRPFERIVASHHFKEGAMKAIIAEAERESSRSEHRGTWRGWRGWAAATAAACLVLLMLALLPMGPWGRSNAAGITLLAQSAQAMSNLQTVHMIGRMRTLPADNFELIGIQYDFVPLEIWREYGNPARWRIEKSGRVVVMDGQASTLYIRPGNLAVRGTPQAGFVEWLRPLLNPDAILEQEQQAARSGAAEAKVTEENGVLTLTVQRTARGSFADDWTKNKTIPESDHTCVYKFDAATKRLEGLQVIVHAGGKDVTVFELTNVLYDETFSPTLFSLQLPPDVNWFVEPATLKPSPAQINGPKEAATYFFEALAREDWDAVLQVYPFSRVSDEVKHTYGGLEVVSIGEPSQSGLYRGFFVPYEVRLPDGSIKKWKLAVRNDNPARHWTVDGGF
jgi:hypothetical protein